MVDKIFIPTCNRVDSQITYDNLPDVLKEKVCMVVQAWERDQYTYPCEYMVLPDTDEYHFSHYYCMAKTRKLIYEAGQDMTYAVIDDDLLFARRNAKYWNGGVSTQEMSKRKCTHDDILEMFSRYDEWLDVAGVTICGCGHDENAPSGREFATNTSLGSALWINGRDFKDELPELDLVNVRIGEDTYFILQMLSRGYGNRVSQEFIFNNQSVKKKKFIKSDIWDTQTFEDTHRDHKYIASKFPDTFKILYDANGERVKGGFRDCGKLSIMWTKTFKPKTVSLEELFNE